MTVPSSAKKSPRAYRPAPARVDWGRSRRPHNFHFSRDQFAKLIKMGIFEGRRVQLLEGELIEMPAVSPTHRTSLLKTDALLRRIFPSKLIAAQLPMQIGDSEPEPSLAVLPGTLDDYLEDHPDFAQLVVEVSPTLRRDYLPRKSRIYAQANIPEFWILNLKARELEVLREPADGSYTHKQVLKENETVSPLAAPQAKIAVLDMLP